MGYNANEAKNKSENVVQSNRSDNENAGQKELVESQEEKVVSSNINRHSDARLGTFMKTNSSGSDFNTSNFSLYE